MEYKEVPDVEGPSGYTSRCGIRSSSHFVPIRKKL